MKDVYETLEHEKVSLSRLRGEEREYLAALFRRFEEGLNYLSFKHLYADPDSMVFSSAKRLGRAAEETPLYKVCDDLATRLGIAQRYLVREEVVHDESQKRPLQRELTTGQVAELAGCSPQAVRKAIVTWRLRARKVGRLALVMEKDAIAFARSVRPYGRKRRDQSGSKRVAGSLVNLHGATTP